MRGSEREAIAPVLARLGLSPGEGAVAPLSGGLTNRSFRVTLPSGDVVVRLGGPETALLGIDRAGEQVAAAIAATLGIGAEVVYADPAADVLVTRFIGGSTLTGEKARAADCLPRIAATVRRVHDGPDFSGTFAPWTATHRLLAHARHRGVAQPPAMDEALKALERLRGALGECTEPRPCHNDLLAANFLEHPDGIRLIDWEYAAMGDPYFDLGNLAVNLGLAEDDHAPLLAAYGVAPDERALARVALMRLASDLREASWGYLQSALAAHADVDYVAYGSQHLARFLAGTRHPAFPAWLAAAEG